MRHRHRTTLAALAVIALALAALAACVPAQQPSNGVVFRLGEVR